MNVTPSTLAGTPLKSHWSSCGLYGYLQVQEQHSCLLTWASWMKYARMHACSHWQHNYKITQFVVQRSCQTKPKPKSTKKKMTLMMPLRVGLSLYVIPKHVSRELGGLEVYCLLSKLNTFEYAQRSLSQRQLPRSPIGWLKVSSSSQILLTTYEISNVRRVGDELWGWVASRTRTQVGYQSYPISS